MNSIAKQFSALWLHQSQRSIGSKSTRNKGVIWIGQHKDPLTEEQRLRLRNKHKPFVLGRDNVKRDFTPIKIPEEYLSLKKGLYYIDNAI